MMSSATVSPMVPLDWNIAWQEALKQRSYDRHDSDHWNQRAASFAQNASKSDYADHFVRLLTPQPHWSVLDVGCGAGTLAIPIAPLVRRVTAIDFSENMIALLNAHCIEHGIANIHTRVTSWEDDWSLAGIEQHDVAIASRSLVVDDLRTALSKLDSRARHRVYIASLVGDGPFDRRIFDAIGRNLNRGPDYIYVYNLLHQMGIHAEIRFVFNGGGNKVFQNIDDAFERFNWMLGSLTPEEAINLRRYFEQHLCKTRGGWTLAYKHTVRWAVIYWNKGH
nr:class I SAM-dependent methyltransferase [uncultured Desulfobulbus sp.]